jgi:hypothetical protein
VEEARFYLEHFMMDQARAALEKLESLTSDPSVVEPLRAQIATAGSQPAAEAEVAEIAVEEAPDFDVQVDTHAESPGRTEPSLAGYRNDSHVVAPPAAEPLHVEPANAETFEIEEAPVEPAVAEAPHHEPAHAEPPETESGDLASFVADLESSLGESFPSVETPAAEPLPAWPVKKPASAPAPAPAVTRRPTKPEAKPEPVVARAEVPAPAASAAAAAPALSYSSTPVRPLGAGAQAMHPGEGVDLSEMFGELKQELEEDTSGGSADEDPETHYNLGVAFREMGLLDEAIAELQKVCTSIDRGQPFSQTIQTYTWLAQCFLDKGVPEAAIRWYEKALSIPGLDQDSKVAINYELGSACESAQDKPAALRHFTEVYGANIDYRDVAERIQALKS